MTKNDRTLKARISGHVQGVSFRAWTKGEAERLGLTGWVRNEADGSVSALFSGSPQALETMTERLWTGPASARVASVQIEEAAQDEPPTRFEIRY
ncbi:MAG: acylphosphatase [Oricola sp.]